MTLALPEPVEATLDGNPVKVVLNVDAGHAMLNFPDPVVPKRGQTLIMRLL